jgi:hypothetical protein
VTSVQWLVARKQTIADLTGHWPLATIGAR